MCVCVCVCVCLRTQRSESNVLTVSRPWATVPSLRVSWSPLPPLSLKSIVEQKSHSYFYIIQVRHEQVPRQQGSQVYSK